MVFTRSVGKLERISSWWEQLVFTGERLASITYYGIWMMKFSIRPRIPRDGSETVPLLFLFNEAKDVRYFAISLKIISLRGPRRRF